MPSNPDEFLSVANLLTEFNNEAAYRSTVSRSYYAVYHHALHTIKIKNPIASGLVFTGPSHEQLVDKLLHGNTSAWRQVAYKVRDFKKERAEADYVLTSEVSLIDANDAIAKAKSLIEDLNSIS